MSPARFLALSMLMLSGCAIAPTSQKPDGPRPPEQSRVMLAELDTATGSSGKVPIPAHCLRPPTGEEVTLPPQVTPPVPKPAPLVNPLRSPGVIEFGLGQAQRAQH